jgi:hypothetical protein
MEHGKFIISLDFELFWGVRHNKTIENYGKSILGVHSVLPRMLTIFEKFNINVTFATVGFLFFDKKESLISALPELTPTYSNPKYSPYEKDIYDIGDDYQKDLYHYGLPLIKLIQNHENHEISTHTFSHYFCLESGQTVSQFRADLNAAIKVAKENNIAIKSIIFPRNQYSGEYLQVCKELGITNYRNHDTSWLYKGRNSNSFFLMKKVRKILRFIDSYLPVSGFNSFDDKKMLTDPIVGIPGGFFLRSFSRKYSFLEPLKVFRIQASIIYAAKRKKCFHLWWHPHNYGENQEQNCKNLQKILKTYQFCEAKYGMKSYTMTALTESVLNK